MDKVSFIVDFNLLVNLQKYNVKQSCIAFEA